MVRAAPKLALRCRPRGVDAPPGHLLLDVAGKGAPRKLVPGKIVRACHPNLLDWHVPSEGELFIVAGHRGELPTVNERHARPTLRKLARELSRQPTRGHLGVAEAHICDEPQVGIAGRPRRKPRRNDVKAVLGYEGDELPAVLDRNEFALHVTGTTVQRPFAPSPPALEIASWVTECEQATNRGLSERPSPRRSDVSRCSRLVKQVRVVFAAVVVERQSRTPPGKECGLPAALAARSRRVPDVAP